MMKSNHQPGKIQITFRMIFLFLEHWCCGFTGLVLTQFLPPILQVGQEHRWILIFLWLHRLSRVFYFLQHLESKNIYNIKKYIKRMKLMKVWYWFWDLQLSFCTLNSDRKFYVVDGQNASLAGGVAMGAIANFMVQPYAAIIIGSAAGLISCYGYRVLQVRWIIEIEWNKTWISFIKVMKIWLSQN